MIIISIVNWYQTNAQQMAKLAYHIHYAADTPNKYLVLQESTAHVDGHQQTNANYLECVQMHQGKL